MSDISDYILTVGGTMSLTPHELIEVTHQLVGMAAFYSFKLSFHSVSV